MLFEKLVMARIRSTRSSVTVHTGLAYGHKILKIGDYQFTEIDDSTVHVEGPGFSAKCESWEKLEFIFNALHT